LALDAMTILPGRYLRQLFLPVSASAAKQSTVGACGSMVCFGATLLAMTNILYY
jgi:hypothetical protein